MRKCLLFVALFVNLAAAAQTINKKLGRSIQEKLDSFHGQYGVYIKNLRTGATLAINADTVFPTASIVKVPILVGVMDNIRNGELHYDSTHTYRDSLLYEGEDILGSFKDGEKITLKKVIMLMLTTSDNTASLWLQKLAGTGTRINELMDSIGFAQTRVNSRTPGREANRTVFGWGQTTPREIGTLFEKIYRYTLFDKTISDRMLRSLGRNFWDQNEAISSIPPTIEVFSKNGCVNAVRSEVLLVNAPNNPYIFCIFTKNNKDISWHRDNEAWALAREISWMVWKYFEPKYDWARE